MREEKTWSLSPGAVPVASPASRGPVAGSPALRNLPENRHEGENAHEDAGRDHDLSFDTSVHSSSLPEHLGASGWLLLVGSFRMEGVPPLIHVLRLEEPMDSFNSFLSSPPLSRSKGASPVPVAPRWPFLSPFSPFPYGCADRSSEAAPTDSPDALRPRLSTSARRRTGKN